MNKYDAERAIIANRPGEPFVLTQRIDGDELADLSALDWQAATEPPTWDDVTAWVAALPLLPADVGHADAIRAQVVTSNLAEARVTQEALPACYEKLLGQAKAGIPWYEHFVGGPSPDDAELAVAWAAFQALDQTTKDRILFNVCRTLAAMMRYHTGDLHG